MRALRPSSTIFLGVLLGAVCGVILPTADANIIDDTYGAGAGSFELGSYVDGGGIPYANNYGYMGVAPGDSATITGWTVGGPGDGVDWLIAPTYRADTGVHAIDLQHLTSSSIATTVPTVAGDVYLLSFSAAASFTWVGTGTNTGVVSAGSLLNQPFTTAFSSTGSTQTYTPYLFLFTATGPITTVQFTAAGASTAYGPVIDSVGVTPIPAPGALLLSAIGMGLLDWLRRRGVV